MFSEHAGFPANQRLSDADPELYNLQKTTRAPHDIMAQAVTTNNSVIEAVEANGVRSYIFIPCIVYGEGQGFGNRISIQTTAIVKAAKGAGSVYDVNQQGAAWSVCHVNDNTALYVALLQNILSSEDIAHGKNGYYLASSGSVAWTELYTAIATALAKRRIIDDEAVRNVDDAALQKMAQALDCPKEFVALQIGGRCSLSASRGGAIGWIPEYRAEHILEVADAEVDLILKHI